MIINNNETIQTTALFRSTRILRRVLETWADLLSLRLSGKPSANPGMKNSQMSKIMIKVKLVTLVESDPKAPFSKATTLRGWEGHYSILWIAPLYPWSLPYNAEC